MSSRRDHPRRSAHRIDPYLSLGRDHSRLCAKSAFCEGPPHAHGGCISAKVAPGESDLLQPGAYGKAPFGEKRPVTLAVGESVVILVDHHRIEADLEVP